MATERVYRLTAAAIIAIIWIAGGAHGKSDPGKTETFLSPNFYEAKEERPLLANSKIYVTLSCDSTQHLDVIIYWQLTEWDCWFSDQEQQLVYQSIVLQNGTKEPLVRSSQIEAECPSHLIVLPQVPMPSAVGRVKASSTEASKLPAPGAEAKNDPAASDKNTFKKSLHPLSPSSKPIVVIPHDGIFELQLKFKPVREKVDFQATVRVDIIGPHGYISATDWPLLPFYLIMCIVYVIFGIIWLVVSFAQWRDLLRIQFWIGGVILLGMLEKAFFYAEYQSLNHSGDSVQGAELAAEFVSCAKRTLARMLVIIMSLGFGIVKPRLGPMLHRVVGVGALYFVLACVESYLRVMRTKYSDRNQLLVAAIPLAVLDTGICWWIFTSLVQTTRTLRLRRNMVKLSLYRHFTNTLIFAVIASVIFMICALRMHSSESCTPNWHDIWIDTAFWHVLFSVLLLVIMILWRPTNNNQRYAFTPLLDNPEDEDDEEEEDQFVADAYGVKMRGTYANGNRTPPSNQRSATTEEDDLRWVEENIPSSMGDPALPVLDSDEEIINTKFEVSKMQ